jgi:xylulokinase
MRLAGVDIGTTSCKAVVIDEAGRVVAQAVRNYELSTPQPGWAEQNPEDWVGAARSCIQEVGAHDAIGFTGQMHGATFLDTNGTIIRPAILWNDARTKKQVELMTETAGLTRFFEQTCNPPLVGFTAPKVLWLRQTEPENYGRLNTVLLPKDYVRFSLGYSEQMETEVTDASGTAVFDVIHRRWSDELVSAFGLESLAVPCAESVAAAAAGDQAAGAVGVGAVTSDVMSVSLGTSGVVFSPQDDCTCDAQGRTHTFCHANGKWHSMSVMLSCGGALRWVRDVFGFSNYDEMADLANRAKTSHVVFRPYLAGERTPHNDPDLRGSLENLSLSDGRAEVAKAVFVGVTAGLRDGFRMLCELRGGVPAQVRVIGGGARSDYWMQLLADAIGVTALRMETDEGPAFGAAILAGLRAGAWPNLMAACRDTVRTAAAFEPKP